jgi:hypothetical protein
LYKIGLHLPYTAYGASLPGLRGKKPFYAIARDTVDTDIVNLFIKAITGNGPDDASVYLSKNLKAVGALDFEELKKVFNENIAYKYLSKVRFSHLPAQIVTNSILVMNEKVQKSSIVHVYMVKEPDMHGRWKICGIEKE